MMMVDNFRTYKFTESTQYKITERRIYSSSLASLHTGENGMAQLLPNELQKIPWPLFSANAIGPFVIFPTSLQRTSHITQIQIMENN